MNSVNIILFLVLNTFLSTTSFSQSVKEEQHRLVAVRMVGHEVLLQLGNDTSLVLPVERVGNRYKIQFDTEFEFQPENFISTIDSVIETTKIATHYLVEVENCSNNAVVYSYEFGAGAINDIIPCKTRLQSKGCYSFFITILDFDAQFPEEKEKKEESDFVFILLFGVVALVVLVLFIRKKKGTNQNLNIISLGNFQFDRLNMSLVHQKDKIELTSKECDLLYLLYSSVNNVVERDVILQQVWGDEGDYIGRTLDVFISKLRKKLENDDTVKIVNVRGVGYRLIVN